MTERRKKRLEWHVRISHMAYLASGKTCGPRYPWLTLDHINFIDYKEAAARRADPTFEMRLGDETDEKEG
jgi:hypothetical protein